MIRNDFPICNFIALIRFREAMTFVAIVRLLLTRRKFILPEDLERNVANEDECTPQCSYFDYSTLALVPSFRCLLVKICRIDEKKIRAVSWMYSPSSICRNIITFQPRARLILLIFYNDENVIYSLSEVLIGITYYQITALSVLCGLHQWW